MLTQICGHCGRVASTRKTVRTWVLVSTSEAEGNEWFCTEICTEEWLAHRRAQREGRIRPLRDAWGSHV